MNLVFLLTTLLFVLIFLGSVVYLMKKHKMYLRYALKWIFTGVIMIILALFPSLLRTLFNILGIQVYSNGIFAILLFFILVILMSLTSIVSGLNNKNRRLTQEIALLERRIRDMEEHKKQGESDNNITIPQNDNQTSNS